MPNLVGMTRTQAYAALQQKQLFFTTKGPGANTANWLRVVGEIPAAGSSVPVRSTVTLLVSLRLAPSAKVRTTTHPASHQRRHYFSTPNLQGQNQSFTQWFTHRHAYHLIVLRIGTKVGRWNDVLIQYPRPGQRVPVGTPIIVTVEHLMKVPAGQKHVPLLPPTPKAPKIRHAKVHFGVATWYNYVPGRCATWYLPYGTRIWVKDLRNGHVISCVVTDREGAHGNRAVDLNETQFSQLAPLGRGVVPVRVWW